MMKDFSIFSPNMLKTFELCPRKFYYRYIKNISMPVNDEIFEFGKNIHALASYYLRGEFIDNLEKSLSDKENEIWQYLKSSEYFDYDVINTEYNLSFREGKYFFGGRLDALLKKGDEYFILDYKTGSAPKGAKYDFQTIIYLLAVIEFYKTENVSFVYLDLKNKENVRIKLTDNLKNEYKTKLNDIVKKIESVESYSKRNECNCEYKIICY